MKHICVLDSNDEDHDEGGKTQSAVPCTPPTTPTNPMNESILFNLEISDEETAELEQLALVSTRTWQLGHLFSDGDYSPIVR